MHREDFDKVLKVKGQKRLYFTRNENELTSPKRITDTDIFVETNLSARNTTQVCRQLIAAFGYSDDDLKVAVHAGKAGNGESDKYTLGGKFSEDYLALRFIYDVLEAKIKDFGDDVKINIRKYYVGFMRNKSTFAVVKLIKDGIYLGLSLNPLVEHDRLRGVNRWRGWSWVNKVILVSKVEEVDDQLIGWVEQSYNRL